MRETGGLRVSHLTDILTAICFFRRNPQSAVFFEVLLQRIKPPLLNHPKHITHILHHDPGDVGHGIDVVFSVVGEAGAGDEVEVFEDGVEAFGEAGVEFA